MASKNVNELTKADIVHAAKNYQFTRKMAKWTVIINGKEFPARPLVLTAACVPPNDPTNSHQAIAMLKSFGLEVRYEGKVV